MAEPEKAILDMVHLHPGGDDRSYIEELRLDFDALRPDRLEALAAVAGTPKLARAARVLRDIGRDAPALDSAMKDHLGQLVGGQAPLRARNIAREYLQARILGALQRAGAMTTLAFHGGTSLRFLFGLPRYSEDLDFALEGDASRYDLRRYLRAIRAELSAEGYHVELRMREHRAVHSAFVRFPGALYEIGLSPHADQVLAVKVEVDTNPPAGATTDTTLVRRHETLRLFHHDRASLLAGKLHAVLQRPYTKGRDLHDLVWYLSDP